MRVHLIFGFLGSGKTTLAKHLLAQVGTGMKTAIIVNEFGEVGVDGDILRGQNIDVVELNSGCLCCTLRGSLLMAVEELRDKSQVECVIVEATGIAQPSELLDSLAHASRSHQLDIGPLVTVVDVARMLKLESMLGDFYLEQIETADLIVANKIDLTQHPILTEATRRLRELNPDAQLIFAQRGEVPLSVIVGDKHSDWVARTIAEWGDQMPEAVMASTHDRLGAGHAHTHDDHMHHHPHEHGHVHEHHHGHSPTDHHGHSHSAHGSLAAAQVVSFVARCGARGSAQGWSDFFQRLPESVWRAKGFVQCDGVPTLIQFTMGQLEMTPAQRQAGGELVFIGCGMDQAALESAVALLSH